MYVSQADLGGTLPTRGKPSTKGKSREKPKGIVVKSAATKDPDSVKKYVDSLADSKGFVKRTTLITLLKVFGLYKPTGDAERVLRRLAPNPDGLIPKAALVDFFEKEARYERGKLTEEDIGKVFDSFSREGVLTFAILMKNAEELANKIGEKDAKLMVKIMGHGKDHITKADFIKALTRKQRVASLSKDKSKDKKTGRA